MHPVIALFERFPIFIEDRVRWIDEKFAGTRPFLRDRSLLAFALPLPVYVFILGGPAMLSWSEGHAWRGGFATAGVLALIVAIQFLYFRQNRLRGGMAWMHFSMVSGLAVGTFFLASRDATEASGAFYRHYYGWVALTLMAIAVPVPWYLRKQARFALPAPMLADFKAACDPGAIVAPRAKRPIRLFDVFSSFVVSIMETPLHIVTPVAFYVVLMPAAFVTRWWVVLAAVVSWLLFAAANYDPGRDGFVRFVRRNFLTGGSLVVTFVVIAFAALRFAGVDYVTTVLDAEGISTVLSYICSTYAALWLYDFWVNQATIDLLGDLHGYTKGTAQLRRHGSGRLMIVGPDGEQRRMLGAAAFLRAIANTAPAAQREPLRENARSLEQHLRAFYLTCSAGLVLAIVGWGFGLSRLDQAPGLPVPSATQAPQAAFDLASRLKQRGETAKDGPVLLLAASGGGTRAAVYAAAVLHGLHRSGKLEQLLLGSGVSGGSAALAYYAAHRSDLKADDAWPRMQERLARPFIDEVLAGLGEWRIVTGSRLESLLAESFERHLAPDGRKITLGSVADLGLVFNTALCGVEEGGVASKDQAGGRLVITNLAAKFEDVDAPAFPPYEMPYHAVRAPEASVFAAAALSANFPPVFSNAAVDLQGDAVKRFWVTDGGAVENRGEVSILLALAEALARLRDTRSGTTPLPPITVIVAEASAIDASYKSDRGVGAKFAAAEQLTKLIVRELRARVTKLHEQVTGEKDRVKFVELPMPDALRVAGAFGTHWMMPSSMRFLDKPARDGKPAIHLSKTDALWLIDAFFDPALSVQHLQTRLGALTTEEAQRVFDETLLLRTAWSSIQ